MLEKIVEYCKNNLTLVIVVAACVLLILIAIIALCVKKSKAKNATKQTAQTKPQPAVKEAPAPVAEEKPTPTPAPVAEEKPTPTPAPAAKVAPAPAAKAAPAPTAKAAPAPAPAVTEEKATEPKKTEKAQPTVAKKASASPAEPAKKTGTRTGRYSGKWVVCRVVTAAHAEGNIHDEAADEMFFFELRASNGEKLLTSEEYTTYTGAVNGIATHKANIEKDNFRITLSKKGDYIFKLLNGKNMLLCMGEHYATRASCESAIESAKRFAKTAVIDENVQDIVIPTPADDEDEPMTIENENIHGKWIIHSNTAEDGEKVFYFELYASNGEKLLSSEEYTTYTGAVNGIETHKTNIERGNFRVSFTKRGDYIYKLLNGNNQLLCLGEHYKTRRRCENAIDSVKRFSKVSPVLTAPDTVK